jgi:hypothetical protein
MIIAAFLKISWNTEMYVWHKVFRLFSEEFYILWYNSVQSVKNKQRFRRNMSLPPSPGPRISEVRYRRGRRWQAVLSGWFLLWIFFDPEDGGDMIRQNVSWLPTYYMSLYSRRKNSPRSPLWELQTLCMLLICCLLSQDNKLNTNSWNQTKFIIVQTHVETQPTVSVYTTSHLCSLNVHRVSYWTSL